MHARKLGALDASGAKARFLSYPVVAAEAATHKDR